MEDFNTKLIAALAQGESVHELFRQALSALHYREMFQDLKQRGLENVLLFVSDDLTGLGEVLTNEFPMAL